MARIVDMVENIVQTRVTSLPGHQLVIISTGADMVATGTVPTVTQLVDNEAHATQEENDADQDNTEDDEGLGLLQLWLFVIFGLWKKFIAKIGQAQTK